MLIDRPPIVGILPTSFNNMSDKLQEILDEVLSAQDRQTH